MRKAGVLAFAALAGFPAIASAQSNEVIVKRIIAESRDSYRGACPCPYDMGARRQRVRPSQRI